MGGWFFMSAKKEKRLDELEEKQMNVSHMKTHPSFILA